MTQKIGLEAVLEMAHFNQGAKQYESTIGGMNTKTSLFSKALGGLGGAITTLAKVGIGAAIGGIAALSAVLVSSVKDAAEAQRVDAQLNAVLKATGGVAGITKKSIVDLANALSQVTPYEDEVIISTETMLLQFKNISEEVFPQATEMALDLATRLGIDATSAAKLLGKALEEPGEGLLRLKQAGVAFTDEQEKMIKKMVEAGDVAGAQKYIMDELKKSIGGAAKAAGNTFAGKLEILKNSIGNVKEAIGTAFLPILTKLADKFNEFILTHGPQLTAMLDKLTTETIPNIVHALSPFVKAFKDLAAGDVEGAISAFAAGIGEVAKHLLGMDPLKASELGAAINNIGQAAREYGTDVANFLISLATTGWEAGVQWFIDNGDTLKDNFGTIGTQAGLAADNLKTMFATVTKDGPTANTVMAEMVRTGLGTFALAAEDLGSGLASVNLGLEGLNKWIGTTGGTVEEQGPGINGFLVGLKFGLDGIINPLQTSTNITLAAQGAWAWLGETLKKAGPDIKKALPEIDKALTTFSADVAAWINSIPGTINTAVLGIEDQLEKIGAEIVAGIKAGVEQAWGDFVAYIVGLMPGIIKAIMDEIQGGSPAKAFMPIGESMAQGVAVGWSKTLAGMNIPGLGGWTMPAMAGAGTGGGDTISNSYGGDTISMNINSAEAWAMAQRWVEGRRMDRLNRGM